MNQSVYLISTDFFENPELGCEFIKDKVQQSCRTEKLVLVFDPMMLPYFSFVAQTNNNILEKMILDYYSVFEKQDKNNLLWYELDDHCNFYISTIGSLLLELDYEIKQIHAIGLLPLTFKHGNVFLYFSISPYDIEDKYNLIGYNSYSKHYQGILAKLIEKGILPTEKGEEK